MQPLSRREICQRFLALLLCRVPLRGQSTAVSPETAGPENAEAVLPAAKQAKARVYRADAVILVLGMSVYRREGVGSGRAFLENGERPESRTLFFAAGSDPKRAQGFNRLGWMREVVVGPAASPSDISYFGILTSSQEASLDQARKAARDPEAGRSVFDTVAGRNTAGHSRSATARFEFPSTARWSDDGLVDRARSAFEGQVNWRETSWPKSPEQAPPTFLAQLTGLLGQRARRCSGRYVYNEQEYTLELESQDERRGGGRLLPVRGLIRNLRTKESTLFRVWMEDGSDVPVRIEFQPRSFLKLTFTAVPA